MRWSDEILTMMAMTLIAGVVFGGLWFMATSLLDWYFFGCFYY